MCFREQDANKYTVAADTHKLRALWAREASYAASSGMRLAAAIEYANEAVEKAIRRAKRKGRR